MPWDHPHPPSKGDIEGGVFSFLLYRRLWSCHCPVVTDSTGGGQGELAEPWPGRGLLQGVQVKGGNVALEGRLCSAGWLRSRQKAAGVPGGWTRTAEAMRGSVPKPIHRWTEGTLREVLYVRGGPRKWTTGSQGFQRHRQQETWHFIQTYRLPCWGCSRYSWNPWVTEQMKSSCFLTTVSYTNIQRSEKHGLVDRYDTFF